MLFFSVQITAQHINLEKASTLFSEQKYSAAQALFQQLIFTDRTDEQAVLFGDTPRGSARC